MDVNVIDGGIEIIARDSGPGITDVARAMEDDYSTKAGSMGVGLPGVKRLMDEFEIDSAPGTGTTVVARKRGAARLPETEYFIAKRPKTAFNACGDTAIVKEFDGQVFIGVIDVLGSGVAAHEVATVCERFLADNYRRSLLTVMHGLHKQIRGTRGAVASMCLFNSRTAVLKYVGIGDTTARRFGAEPAHMVSQPGIVGYQMGTPREQTTRLCDGDVLLLHTDGVRSHFQLEEYAQLLNDDAKQIATRVVERFGKDNDDALCVAMRYQT